MDGLKATNAYLSQTMFPQSPSLFHLKTLAFLLVLLLFWATGCLKSIDPGLPVGVQNSLKLAHLNRSELMKAILKFDSPEDSIQLESLYFLISNLPQHYTIYVSLADSQGNRIQYDPLSFASETAIKQYLDSLSKINGTIKYRSDSFDVDITQITSEFLVANIENANQTWKESKWSQEYTFNAFKKWVLPYRAANEPITNFRSHFKEKFKNEMLPGNTTIDVINRIDSLINNSIAFDERYEREPKTQSVDEIEQSRKGSSLDLAIYKVYALRSMGIPSSIDYCPFYSDTTRGFFSASALLPDGSWKSLPPKEKGNPFSASITPKVYRRTFEGVSESLYSVKESSNHTPPFLGHYDYIDVSNEYLPVENINLTNIITDEKFVYLAVFNDEKWKAVDWGSTDSTGNITFMNAGKGHRYRLVQITEKEMVYLTDPFFLDK